MRVAFTISFVSKLTKCSWLSQPSNVGFTKSNRVKIFDFGLAREIVDSSKKLTGNTGSLRYMAPEGTSHATLMPVTIVYYYSTGQSHK